MGDNLKPMTWEEWIALHPTSEGWSVDTYKTADGDLGFIAENERVIVQHDDECGWAPPCWK